MTKIKEVWKDVPQYKEAYQVSSLGNVRSLDRIVYTKKGSRKLIGKNLSTSKLPNGYMQVGISYDGVTKNYYTHQLVMMAFKGFEPNGKFLIVDHIDSDKTNNNIENLQLITHRENLSKDKRNSGRYSSEYVGVSWNKKIKKWVSYIQLDGKINYLGSFLDELEAHLTYQFELYHYKSMNNKF